MWDGSKKLCLPQIPFFNLTNIGHIGYLQLYLLCMYMVNINQSLCVPVTFCLSVMLRSYRCFFKVQIKHLFASVTLLPNYHFHLIPPPFLFLDPFCFFPSSRLFFSRRFLKNEHPLCRNFKLLIFEKMLRYLLYVKVFLFISITFV